MSGAVTSNTPAGLSPVELAAQKKRYGLVLLVTVLAVVGAAAGIYGHVGLAQRWGLPLFVAAMVLGFGAQIAFIVGLVKSSRPSGKV